MFWCFDSFLITKAIQDWGEFFGIHGQDVRTGRPDTPSESGRTWAVARLAHFSQWSGQHIQIGYAIVRVWWSWVSCASPWGSLDKGARHVSSWAIPMELLRIAMCALCHQGEGSLHLAHADGPPCDTRHSSFHPGKNSVRPTFHLLRISHIRNSVRPMFHLLQISHIRNSIRSNMSKSSDSAYLESIHSRQFSFSGQLGASDTCDPSDPFRSHLCNSYAQLQCSPEASWYFLPTFWDILGYFSLDIWCLNPQSLLVTHLS